MFLPNIFNIAFFIWSYTISKLGGFWRHSAEPYMNIHLLGRAGATVNRRMIHISYMSKW